MTNLKGIEDEGNYPQLKNALNNLKGLSYYFGSSRLDALRTLLDTYEKVGDIDQRIRAVAVLVEREDERQKDSALSQASQNMMEQRKVYEGHKVDLQAQKDKEMALLIKTNEIIYKKFDSFHEEHLAKQKNDNQHLSEVVNAMKSGKKISDTHKKKLTKTPEQRKKAKECNEHIIKTKFVAEADIELHTKELTQIEERIKTLSPHQKEERRALQERSKFHRKHHEIAKKQSKKADLHVVQLAEQVKIIHEGVQAVKDKDQHEFMNLQLQELRDMSNPILLGIVAQALEKQGVKVDLTITLSAPAAEQMPKSTTLSSILAAGKSKGGQSKAPDSTPNTAKPTSALSR